MEIISKKIIKRVCLCERERERERDEIKRGWFKLLVTGTKHTKKMKMEYKDRLKSVLNPATIESFNITSELYYEFINLHEYQAGCSAT